VPIVALDFPSASAALAMVERLGPACRFYKVGNELFTTAGPRLVTELVEGGCRVFLDLKFHDIPNTVAGGVRGAAALGASLVTVHAAGGEAMLRGAVDAAAGRIRILAVTVLTSLSGDDLSAVWGRPVGDLPAEVERVAALAERCGVDGVVCSGGEAARLRRRFGDALELLVPGVRLPGDSAGDQRRVVTPADAAAAGASYVVLGRTVTRAADPVAAMRHVVASLV